MCKIPDMNKFQRVRAERMYYYARRLCKAQKDSVERAQILKELHGIHCIFINDNLDTIVTSYWKGSCRGFLMRLKPRDL